MRDIDSRITAVQAPNVYTVSQLTDELRILLEEGYPEVTVEGEISGWMVSRAGHAYFRLKDEGAVLESVIWKGTLLRLGRLGLADGQAVQCTGRLSIYPRRGQYQMIVERVKPAGLGLLQQQFEELKRRLAKEGLFDAARKRPLPVYPRRIGIATSATGAALQDFLKIAREHRLPLEVVVAPCRVQGVEAPAEIAQALRELDGLGPDLLIAMRGGGSLEDLWAFNEEVVARAIAACRTPVVSAVGHEVDFTIADFVADIRAPTPTGAALLLVDMFNEHRAKLIHFQANLAQWTRTTLQNLTTQIEHIRQALQRYHPRAWVEQYRRQLDETTDRLVRGLLSRTQADRMAVRGLGHRLDSGFQRQLRELRHRTQSVHAHLQALNPQATLRRGFAVCQRSATGKIVFTPNEVEPDELLSIRVRDGTFGARATGTIAGDEQDLRGAQ